MVFARMRVLGVFCVVSILRRVSARVMSGMGIVECNCVDEGPYWRETKHLSKYVICTRCRKCVRRSSVPKSAKIERVPKRL